MNNKFGLVRSLLGATALLMMGIAPSSIADTVFRLQVSNNGQATQAGFATLVADNTVITSAGLVDQGDQWVVEDHVSNARLVVSLLALDEENDLALLQVNGLAGEFSVLAMEEAVVGRNISVNVVDQRRVGTVHSLLAPTNDANSVRHTAVILDDEFAAPLFNNCGELLGVSQSDRVSFLNSRLETGDEFGFAGELQALREFLQQNDINIPSSSSKCLSDADQLQRAEEQAVIQERELRRLEQEREQLEQDQLALEEEQAAANQRNEELSLEAQQRLEELAAREEDLLAAEETIAAAQLELEEAAARSEILTQETQRQEDSLRLAAEAREAEAQMKFYILLGSGLIVSILLVLVFIQVRKRKNQREDADQEIEEEKARKELAQTALAEASVEFPDLLFLGTDKEGGEIKLKINGTSLIRSGEGQIIGRSAQHADHVLNLEHVSRQHLRIKVKGRKIFVEDLETLNGSAINRTDMQANSEAEITDGDEVRIGLQQFVVRIIPDNSND